MQTINQTEPTVIVIFGGSGDLTWRKLMPALYNLYLADMMPKRFMILGLGRQDMSDQQFRKRLHEGVNKFSRSGKADAKTWNRFAKNIQYKGADFNKA